MTQQERIIKYMNDFGSITALEAVSDLGITQLFSSDIHWVASHELAYTFIRKCV